MRINQFIARATGLSRRAADQAIAAERVYINQQPAKLGGTITPEDTVTLDGQPVMTPTQLTLIMLNKPFGYVCSRNGQGSPTIYELLPADFHALKPIGRLDKDSSGLLLLTNDGNLANQLTHPRYAKEKIYEVKLNKELSPHDQSRLRTGINLPDGPSTLRLQALPDNGLPTYEVRLTEGRNRQIRRSFAALGYTVTKLHRTQFGPYALGQLELAKTQAVQL